MCQSHSTQPPTHSTCPHNAKKALYVTISGEIPENYVHKSYWHKLIFDVPVIFSPQCQQVPGAITSARSTRLGADYSYEDSGSCVSGEEEGGIV